MSDELEQQEQAQETGGGLRKQLEETLALKSQLEKELADARKSIRDTKLTSLLSSKGVSEKVAKFVPADLDTDDAISSWLEENKDIFVPQQAQAGSEPPSNPANIGNNTQPNIDPSLREASQKFNSFSSGGSAPDVYDDALNKIQNANSLEDLEKVFTEISSVQL